MRCKNCDYRLWGVPVRECPECGTPFRPSEFEFVPNSIRFCCPHCGQDYYGTGPTGHLEPYAFNCVTCGRQVNMDEMTLFPTAGLQEEQTQVEVMPWLERRKIGFFRAWLRSIWMSMVSPSRLAALTPSGSSGGEALWFAVITAGVATLAGMLPLLIFPMVIAGARGGMGLLGLGMLITSVIWPVLLIGLWGATAHGILAMSGDCRFGLGRTYQALSYSAGPNIMMCVPCMGFYLAPVALVWWIVSGIIMLRESQRVSAVRATAAVASFPMAVIIGMAMLVSMVIVPSITGAGQAMQATGQRELMSLSSDLTGYASNNSGKGPPHAIDLALWRTFSSGPASALDFASPADWGNVPLGSGTLQSFSNAAPAQQNAMAKAAAAALPPNVIAHRLGDFVFTYHGFDFNTADPNLWIVLWLPEKPLTPTGTVHVGLASGSTMQFAAGTLPLQLQSQNALRAKRNLPPLPDPRTVTHTQPAVAMPTTQSSLN